MLEELTKTIKTLKTSTDEATKSTYEAILSLSGVKWSYTEGEYKIKYYTEDKYFNKVYTLITTKSLNRKLINTICKHNGR